MREKSYLIPIKPISWKRCGLAGTTFYDTQVNDKIAFGLYLLKQHGSDPLFEKPLSLDVTFFMPKALKSKKRGDYHSSTPDLDNLIKLLLDAIVATKSIMTDDRIVSIIVAKKIYDVNPRTEFIIKELE
jgi:Holliday junction resolvase RusA-like endonuclease